MLQVFALVILVTFALSSAVAQTPPPYPGYPPHCSNEKEVAEELAKARAAAKGAGFGDAVRAADRCVEEDSEVDPDDNEFNCEAVQKNCPSLYSASEERLRRAKDDLRKEAKDLDKELNDELDERSDLKKDAATLAKEYAEKEDELNSELVTQEKEYKEGLREKDKEALQQIHEIQETIRKIADENRKIVLAANQAMANLAKAKLNARSACREQARKDYQATLAQLDNELKKRGGKIGGGFEGIQNAENYRKFLVGKIKNPEPSENFTLCYSAGDAVENNLQQNNMNGALTMNELSSQIEENNKQRDQLTQQLQQQQQLAEKQKLESFEEYKKAFGALQKKIMTNRQNFEREKLALIDKQRQQDMKIIKLQQEYTETNRKAKNADTRYTCLDNKKLFTASGSENPEQRLAAAKETADSVCGSPQQGCEGICEKVRSKLEGSGSSTKAAGSVR